MKNYAFWQKIFGPLVRLAERKLFFPPLATTPLKLNNVTRKKLGLSCAKLRNVELKIKDNIILGLNENMGEKHEG